MARDLLVLGRSGFVGPAVVEEGLARGFTVTTFHRGAGGAADPGAAATDYAADKRGAEIAVQEAFGDRALLARAGLILGPREDIGRLPWWLARMARGGEILCPGPPQLPIQYIDARDLAGFVLQAASAGYAGAFNVISRRGHATMGTLLEACRAVAGTRDAVLRWVDPGAIAAAGVEPWTELPVWLPADHEYAAMHDADVERAHRAGLRCRPVKETVSDTWTWLSGLHGPPPLREGVPLAGLAPEREREILDAQRQLNDDVAASTSE